MRYLYSALESSHCNSIEKTVVNYDHTCAEVGLEIIPPKAEVLVPVRPHLEGDGWGKLSLMSW